MSDAKRVVTWLRELLDAPSIGSPELGQMRGAERVALVRHLRRLEQDWRTMSSLLADALEALQERSVVQHALSHERAAGDVVYDACTKYTCTSDRAILARAAELLPKEAMTAERPTTKAERAEMLRLGFSSAEAVRRLIADIDRRDEALALAKRALEGLLMGGARGQSRQDVNKALAAIANLEEPRP